MIDKSGKWWVGNEPDDIEEYLVALTAETYVVELFRLSRCNCGNVTFELEIDRSGDAARRTCERCERVHYICDSETFWETSKPKKFKCHCRSKHANLGIGYALSGDEMKDNPDEIGVRWLYVGVRCDACGTLGCFADWKVAQSLPSAIVDSA